MPAHDEDRDPAPGAPEHGRPAHGEPTAHDGPAHDGTDALMAVLLGEDPTARALRDPAFAADHRAAAVDVAVLREQLALIGDALASPVEAGTADGEGAGAPAGRGGAGRLTGGPGTGGGPASGREAGGEAAAGPPVRRPGGGRPGTVSGSRGPHRARRPLRGALGALVAAAAATVVVGAGWLMTQSGGAADPGAGSAAARADSGDAGGKKEGGAAFEGPRRLVCSRLVAEGTVRAVERVPGTGAQHVTLEVSRSYRGGGGDEITFLRYPAGDAPLREGDRVMVGMPAEGAHPDAVIVGEADIAPERTRITAPPTGPGDPACG